MKEKLNIGKNDGMAAGGEKGGRRKTIKEGRKKKEKRSWSLENDGRKEKMCYRVKEVGERSGLGQNRK